MIADRFAADANHPIWLMTLADLGLLLLGFFVLVLATAPSERAGLAQGLRDGFDAQQAELETPREVPPMPLEMSRLKGFANGAARSSSALAPIIAWSRSAAADPRVAITITGKAGAGDVDRTTGSAALLAADRARGVAEQLLAAGAARPDQLVIATEADAAMGEVVLRTGFVGDRQSVAGARQ